MPHEIIEALLFFLPAAVANMTPVFAAITPGLKQWNTPLDFGKLYRGKRILGDSKTWRGVVCGTLMGMVTAVVIAWFHHGPISAVAPLWIGGLLGFGAVFGDAFESFFKRQRDIKPGHSWFPFDQTDYVIGALVFALPFAHYTLVEIISILVIYFGLHLATVYIGYQLGIRNRPI